MEEIIKAIEAEKVRSKMSKTRNSGLYRLGLCKAIEIVLELSEGKEPANEMGNCIQHAVSSSFYCQREIEGKTECETQCEHCKEYYKPLEQ